MAIATRRDFLATASAATLSALAAGFPRAVGAQGAERLVPTADTVIVLWMGGGMAHTETFDPKRYTPFAPGLRPDQVLSTFPSIDTAVDHIKFSEGLEHIARVMDRGTLIRSYTAGDLGFILHSRHQYQWHTGYAPPQTVAAPHLGAIVVEDARAARSAMPAFINIGQRFDRRRGRGAEGVYHGGVSRHRVRPVQRAVPRRSGRGRPPAGGMTPGRFEDRNRLYRRLLDASPIGQQGSDYQRESLLRAIDNAHRLLSSPAAKAFDLSLEPMENIQKYVPGYQPGQQFRAEQDRFGAVYERADGGAVRTRLPAGAAPRRRLARATSR